MNNNPLKKLEALGQSIWLDYIRRDLMASGKLQQLIAEDGLRGITSNPSIFDKAVAESTDYDEEIQAMKNEGKDAPSIRTTIMLRDVGDAADIFRPLYDKLQGKDGFVSIEVNPHFAHDTQNTITEARQ